LRELIKINHFLNSIFFIKIKQQQRKKKFITVKKKQTKIIIFC
jgi:hypothetical protein